MKTAVAAVAQFSIPARNPSREVKLFGGKVGPDGWGGRKSQKKRRRRRKRKRMENGGEALKGTVYIA